MFEVNIQFDLIRGKPAPVRREPFCHPLKHGPKDPPPEQTRYARARVPAAARTAGSPGT